MKLIFISGLLLLFTCTMGQVPLTGRSHLLWVSGQLPLGAFQRTHLAGAGLGYSWSPQAFGPAARTGRLKPQAMAGGDYFLGKKIETEGHPFRFGNYAHIYALGGVLYQAHKPLQLSLLGGPALGIYKGNSELGLTALFQVQYFFRERYAIAPVLQWRKDKMEEALWSMAIRASYAF